MTKVAISQNMREERCLPEQKYNGWINLYKPATLSSNSALYKIKKCLPRKTKIGFAGTLDPLAEGVLPIAIGEATKTISLLHDKVKAYQFEVQWGQETTTLDREGEVVKTCEIVPSYEHIKKSLSHFIGIIEQTPPLYSAVKINGKPAYKYARSGESIEIKSKHIEICDLKIISHEGNKTNFYVSCHKGTYVRSLARDIAYYLGTFAYVTALKRVSSGPFLEKDAILLDKIVEIGNSIGLNNFIQPVEKIISNDSIIEVDEEIAVKLKFGQVADIEKKCVNNGLGLSPTTEEMRFAALCNGKLVAFVQLKPKENMLNDTLCEIKPLRVFNL